MKKASVAERKERENDTDFLLKDASKMKLVTQWYVFVVDRSDVFCVISLCRVNEGGVFDIFMVCSEYQYIN